MVNFVKYSLLCAVGGFLTLSLPGTGHAESSDPFYQNNLSSNYLISQFAQRRHDWQTADKHLENVLQHLPNDPQLIKRKMILSMGSGNYESAIAYAKKIIELEPTYSIAHLFLAAENLKNKNYEQAASDIRKMPGSSLAEFMQPLLKSWSAAGLGKNETEDLNKNTVHIHHSILIADYLNDYEQIEFLLEKTRSKENLSINDLERIGDIYAHIDKPEMAIELYQRALLELPNHPHLEEKITALQNGEDVSYFEPVQSLEEGIAMAFHDMATLLQRDSSDDSARVFSYLSLYLNPNMTESKLLLADIYAKNDQLKKAIENYKNIASDKIYYIDAQRRAASLMVDNGDEEKAIKLLTRLSDEFDDIEARIQIGDIFRRQENFEASLIHYNKAASMFEGEIPSDFWHLLYVRGMAYERTGQWGKAEQDLSKALEYRPEHPFILNYLGYSWADKGQNLDKALELIQQAVYLKPDDGYITDSLGWVYYRQGEYDKAVTYLERAVELLPYDPVINDHLGDAYWKVGRKLEATFQWKRAKNYAEDVELSDAIDIKLVEGLPASEETQTIANEEEN